MCTASVVDSDGGSDSDTATVTIANRVPSVPTVSISPSTPTEGRDDLICVASDSSDDDGQSVSYNFAWTVDGVTYSGTTSTTTYTGDTIPASETGALEIWECTVTPSDGTGFGLAASDSVTIESACMFGDCDENLYLGNGYGIDFVNISAGTFVMGSPSSEVGRSSDETQHTVTLTNDFLASTTEITQAMYYEMMGHQSYDGKSTTNTAYGSYGIGDNILPIMPAWIWQCLCQCDHTGVQQSEWNQLGGMLYLSWFWECQCQLLSDRELYLSVYRVSIVDRSRVGIFS